jgi:D-alanyl-D-alanine carboxypeptidase
MDLLYGMMVASGNDAAQTVAENLGRVYEEFLRGGNLMQTPRVSARDKKDTGSGCEQLFVRLMNKSAKEMG